MTRMRMAYDTAHDQCIYLISDLNDSLVATASGLCAGTLMGPEVAPQFYNPEKHLSDCQIPDKMFRFCLCPQEAT